VTTVNFLRAALRAQGKELPAREFLTVLGSEMTELKMDASFRARYINDGFSGGEKKRAEILQMAMLEPAYAVLDETDSGLDIDALRIVADGVNALRGPNMGALIITHYTRILQYVRPDFVHIMLNGRIVQEGGAELADHLEEKGYDWVREEVAAGDAA
jgi:Fe-S cluster assembly ATP-binding protein